MVGLQDDVNGRTLVDCAREWSLTAGVIAIDAAVHPRKIERAETHRAVLAGTHRVGIAGAARALALADGWAESPLETRLALLSAGLPRPELQVEIHDGVGFVGRVDAWYEEVAVAVEFDGRVKYLDSGRGVVRRGAVEGEAARGPPAGTSASASSAWSTRTSASRGRRRRRGSEACSPHPTSASGVCAPCRLRSRFGSRARPDRCCVVLAHHGGSWLTVDAEPGPGTIRSPDQQGAVADAGTRCRTEMRAARVDRRAPLPISTS